jgi:RNA polymerase sigma-70 factor (ECF subfamily)
MSIETGEAMITREASLEQLLADVLPVAYRVAMNLARNQADAEDIVQEAALNACRGFDGFVEGTNFRAWFLRIVTNVFISRYRRRQRGGMTVALDELDRPDAALAAETGDEESDALAGFISRVETDEILTALEQLPVEYRTVAVLFFVDDLSYQDIARAVGCPIGTVRSRLHRSRAHLKQALRSLALERGYGRGAPSMALVA